MRALVLLVVACGACGAPMRGTNPEARAVPPAGVGMPIAELDRALQEGWAAAKVTPAPASTDGEWFRRVSLDLAGRVPTLDETRAFLDDAGPDRRARTVDRMLGSHAFAETWGELYSDLLFGHEARGAKLEKQYAPGAWLVRAFEENRPYDRLVYDVLTATGDIRQNGALAFLAARASGGGGPEAVAGATARLF